MTTVSKNYAGLIETLSVGEYVEEATFPYMQPLQPRTITQSFSGTSTSNRLTSVGFLGKAPPTSVSLALATGSGWIGIRSDGSQSRGADLYFALRWSSEDPFSTDEAALNHILSRRP